MASSLRWGILSTAQIGRSFVRGVGMSKNGCVQVVASRDWSHACEWAKDNGIPRFVGSYEELLASKEIDAIYNPLPNSLHAEWTLRALEAGIPVLCEKPLARNAEEARTMVALARKKNLLLGEAFMYRYHPVYDRVLQLIEADAIGRVTSVRSLFTFCLEDRTDIRATADLAGGALMDVGCYCVNLARRIAGCEPTRAFAFERRTTVDDTLFGSLDFPNGMLSQFECSIESQHRRRAEITGTKGMIVLENPWTPGEQQASILLRRGEQEEIITTAGANCFHLEAEDFADACKYHRPLRWPVEDAIANMAVIDALYTSARSGSAVLVAAI